MDIDQEVFYADLNWDALLAELGNYKIQYSEISKYPEVKRDLALLLDKNVNFCRNRKNSLRNRTQITEKSNVVRRV